MPSAERLTEFVAWTQRTITGDEKGQAQIFRDRLFQTLGQPGSLDVGGTAEFRTRKAKEDGGGTAFADFVWKPVVLVEMKKRGEELEKHRTPAERYWTRLVPNRPRYVVLCNFDEFWVYDLDTDLDAPKHKPGTLAPWESPKGVKKDGAIGLFPYGRGAGGNHGSVIFTRRKRRAFVKT